MAHARQFSTLLPGPVKDFVKVLSSGWGLPGDVDDIQLDPVEDTSKPFHLTYHLRQDRYFIVPSTSVNFAPSRPSVCLRFVPPRKAPNRSTSPRR